MFEGGSVGQVFGMGIKNPQTFVIPDKRSADPEPMPQAADKSNHCNDWPFTPPVLTPHD
jgi:hypothetical protein